MYKISFLLTVCNYLNSKWCVTRYVKHRDFLFSEQTVAKQNHQLTTCIPLESNDYHITFLNYQYQILFLLGLLL